MPDVKAVYDQQFLPARDAEWHAGYVAAVEGSALATEETFRSAAFQKRLWEDESVSTIGPGSSVTVPDAYQDQKIVDAFWALRSWKSLPDPLATAKHLDSEFDRIINLVSPRHNARRPMARLVRIFATLRVHDVHCLMDAKRTGQFRQWLECSSLGLGIIGQNVLSRHAVREALGPESNVADAVSYNQFAWFVWERVISAAEDLDAAGASPALPLPAKPTDRPKLLLLPAAMQRKGMFYTANNMQLLMSVVRAAENGIETDDLLQQVTEEAPNLNQSSRKNVLSQAVSLNLLAVERGTYRPTTAGQSLLQGDTAADVLTPIFVRNVFGFALILRDLGGTESLTRGEIAKRSQSYYPNWTSEFAPNSLVAWLRDLGLVIIAGSGRAANVTLTDVGAYWSSGLPKDLETLAKVASSDSDINGLQDELDPAVGTFEAASVDDVLSRFANNPDLARFVFSNTQIRLVYAALHSTEGKRFILLAGLSGTGKTSMARAYARAYCEAKGLAPLNHYAQVAVWPDWTDPSGLLGFVNPLADPPSFHETPALRLLLEASLNPSLPYFLCLDEMNLARVEHYFAPFLSAMEGRDGRLAIHAGENTVAGIPPSIVWPRNLFIMGTVNIDETTHPFSDKVLDRAFTFEFWDADLEKWRDNVSSDGAEQVVSEVYAILKDLYSALAPARRHFGYRTCDEVLGFCRSHAGVSLTEALDAAVLAKVLPKVRGDSGGALPKALADAIMVCHERGLNQSKAKLTQMQAALGSLGVVRFWS